MTPHGNRQRWVCERKTRDSREAERVNSYRPILMGAPAQESPGRASWSGAAAAAHDTRLTLDFRNPPEITVYGDQTK
jgi:hypothetical protein